MTRASSRLSQGIAYLAHVLTLLVAAVTHTPVTICNTWRRLSLFFGRISHQASPSRHTPEPRAPGTQKPREKLLTFQRHSVDFPTTKHEPLRFGISLNIHSANKNIVAQTSTVVFDTTAQMSCVTKGNRQGTRPSTPSQKTLCPTEVGFQTP